MMLVRSRMSYVPIRAEQGKDNKMSVLRKKVETQRSSVIKENLNKLAIIASADVKFLQDTFSEINKIHRDWFDEKFEKNKNKPADDGNGDDGDTMFLKD